MKLKLNQFFELKNSWLFQLGCCLFLFSACSVYEPDKRNLKPDDLNTYYSVERTRPVSQDKWWEKFNSLELNQLVERSLEQNLDIHAARGKLRQARALLESAAGGTHPSVTANLGRSRKNQPNVDAVDTFSSDLSASYELDIWGRLDSLKKSEQLSYRATRADLESINMSTAASVVQNWLDIISIRGEISVLKQQVETNENILKVLITRYENGRAQALDILQQKRVLVETKAALPLLESKERVLLNALTLLLGNSRTSMINVKQAEFPIVPDFPGIGIPADLLVNRPDVRSAGLTLQSSDWDIASARADRLPGITLTGQYGYSSTELDTLFDNWVFTLGASLAATLYDGGKKAAKVEQYTAVMEQNLATYRKTVYEAVLEVENAIINEKKQAEYLKLMKQQLAAVKLSFKEAERQYISGTLDYIGVVAEITRGQVLERQLVTQTSQYLKYRVALHRAIGGTWTRKSPKG